MNSNRAYLKLGSVEQLSFLSLQKEGYELTDFEYSFNQGLDLREQAATKVHGGLIKLVLPSLPAKDIIEWGMKSVKFQKGAIVIFGSNDIALEKVTFDKAACIHLDINFSEEGEAYAATSLCIYAETLKFGLGDLDFINNWTK